MIEMLRYLKDYFKKNIIIQFFALVLTILYSIAVILSPIASKYLIDRVLNTPDIGSVKYGILIFFLACVCQPIVGYVKDILFVHITSKITFETSRLMFQKVINSEMIFFDNSKKGDIISRINNDGNCISNFISNFFIIYIKDILIIAMIFFAMFFISVKITFLITVLLVFNLMINKMFDKKFQHISGRIAKNNDALYSYTNQMLDSIVTIKAFCNEEKVLQKYYELLTNMITDSRKKQIMGIFVRNLNNFFGIVSISIIYGIGALDIINGNITLGSVIALGLYFQLILMPLDELINNNIQLSSIKPILDRVNSYLNLKQEKIENINQFDLNKNLTLNNIDFYYNNNNYILSDINVTFPRTGIVSIIGESGSGKSTFVKLLLNFNKPQNGIIKFGDYSYEDIGVNNIRNNIAFVDQDVKLFNMSIIENIKFINNNISDSDIIELFKKVNLDEKIINLKDGYNSIISEKLNLSGGEKQRIGIVMALSKNPNILILDEPTSALDYQNEQNIMNILKGISKNKLIILISHKESTIKYSNKVYKIKNKKLISEI